MKKSLLLWLSIGAFGFFGALARYGISRLLGKYTSAFPIGTLLINLSGAFLLGWFATWAQPRLQISDTVRLGIAVGFLGAYTTFSTYMFETDRMFAAGEFVRGMLYLVGSIVLGLLAVRAGVLVGHQMS